MPFPGAHQRALTEEEEEGEEGKEEGKMEKATRCLLVQSSSIKWETDKEDCGPSCQHATPSW